MHRNRHMHSVPVASLTEIVDLYAIALAHGEVRTWVGHINPYLDIKAAGRCEDFRRIAQCSSSFLPSIEKQWRVD